MPRLATAVGTVVVAVLSIGVFAANQVVDRQRVRAHAAAITGGDPGRGSAAMARRGCGGCHEIPGVANAQGKVGASLAGWSGRVYVDGRLPNTPDNVESWIRDPRAIDPQTAMPPTGVTAAEARDIAAYLYAET